MTFAKMKAKPKTRKGFFSSLKKAKIAEVKLRRDNKGFYTDIEQYADGSCNLFYGDPGTGVGW